MDNRRLKREAKEREDTQKFEAAKKDAVKRKRREAYAEAAGLMTTRAVKTLTRMKAKNVVEEMRAGLTPISFFIKKPGPPPEVCSSVPSPSRRSLAAQVDSEAESDHEAGTPASRARQALTDLVRRGRGPARGPSSKRSDAQRRRQRRVDACVEITFRGASRLNRDAIDATASIRVSTRLTRLYFHAG